MKTDKPPSIPAGTLLAHFQVLRRLGEGGMGTVYEAHDTSLDRSVALKVLRPELSDDPVIVDRFVREARAAARVSHPNLTHIYYVGALGGRRFFAMEYVPGDTLEAFVESEGPQDLGRTVELLVQAAKGLQAAHAAGVVHRDVKPANLMLQPDGVLKVTDFGLAKSTATNVNVTGAGTLLGTPTYMSPEQCRGTGVDHRSDVYALGLVAFFVLTGMPAYRGDALGEIFDGQMNQPLPSVCAVRPKLSPAVDELLQKLCAKKPEDRPESMTEVISLLESVRPVEITPAPITARVFAFVIDGVLMVIAVSAMLGSVWSLHELLGGPSFVYELVGAILAVAAVTVLNWCMEVWVATTPGKWLLHLAVVRRDGTRPGPNTLFARYMLRLPFVPWLLIDPFISGWSWAGALPIQAVAMLVGWGMGTFGHRTLSDVATKTVVIHRSRKG